MATEILENEGEKEIMKRRQVYEMIAGGAGAIAITWVGMFVMTLYVYCS